MFRFLGRAWRKKRDRRNFDDIDPDLIFMDARNLPDFDMRRLEGRLEKPISKRIFTVFGLVCAVLFLVFFSKLGSLQIIYGSEYKERSENNKLKQILLPAPRGIIWSREGVRLAWNEVIESGERGDLAEGFSRRRYIDAYGFGSLLGFVKYPAKDSSGFYYEEEFAPKDGAELYLNEILRGENGLELIETSVKGEIISQSTVDLPISGEGALLSVDAGLQEVLFEEIEELAGRVGFQGGAAAIMDVDSGELLAIVSFPEFSPEVMVEGVDQAQIDGYLKNPNNPFLNRVIAGLYIPGSIIKPFVAIGALEEGVISPEKEIVSTGQLVLPNPYFPELPSIFKDWRAHGAVNMRRALAVSSDVYFYQIGGGFENQEGLGIERLKKYLESFGFGKITGFDPGREEAGLVPDPQWKEKVFEGEIWRVGDTYNTAIGQYGMQITPLQAVVATAALANGGKLLSPSILFTATSTIASGKSTLGNRENFNIVREGMRLAVTEGTAIGLNTKAVAIAAKTGTAELGARKELVNSWVIGFFPYEHPKYAFAAVMERGPSSNLIGATFVMRQVFDWMAENRPEYLTSN